MRQNRPWIIATTMSLLLVGCGAGEEVATSTSAIPSTTTTTTELAQTTTTTTLPATTTTVGVSTTESPSGLPGDPIDFGPVEGDILAVIGVAHDDVLNLRSAPGADQDIVAGIPPLFADLIAAGKTRQLAASMWIEVDYSGLDGWVNLRFVAYLGATGDITADLIDGFGEPPVAASMTALGLVIAENILAEAAGTTAVVSAAPTLENPHEVTYDIVGFEDDSVRGERIHVIGEPSSGGLTLVSVEVTPFCSRGVDESGLCV